MKNTGSGVSLADQKDSDGRASRFFKTNQPCKKKSRSYYAVATLEPSGEGTQATTNPGSTERAGSTANAPATSSKYAAFVC